MEEGLPEIYQLASLFVTASEIETQGIVLLEAAASGLPIVAVRATCIPEIVHHGLNGCLVESGNYIALGRAITDLLLDPEDACRMGQASLQLAQKHTILDTFNNYEKLYAELARKLASQHTLEKVKAHDWQERAKEWLNL